MPEKKAEEKSPEEIAAARAKSDRAKFKEHYMRLANTNPPAQDHAARILRLEAIVKLLE